MRKLSTGKTLMLTLGALFLVFLISCAPAPTLAPLSPETNDIMNLRDVAFAGNKLLFTVDYTYSGDQGDDVWLGAEVLKGEERLIWFGYLPWRVSPGSRSATVTLTFGYNNPPPSVSSDRVRIIMYVGGSSPFYSKTFNLTHTWQATPAVVGPALTNLSPYSIEGWPGPLVVSASNISKTPEEGVFTEGSTIYVSWTLINRGKDITTPFRVSLLLDGSLVSSWDIPQLRDDWYYWWRYRSIGSLPAGTYNLLLLIDPDNRITETDKADNIVFRTITVQGPGESKGLLSLVDNAFFSQAPLPSPVSITYTNRQGIPVSVLGLSGQVMLVVDGTTSAGSLTALVERNGGRVFAQIPVAGLYWVAVRPGSEASFIAAVRPHVADAFPNIQIGARTGAQVDTDDKIMLRDDPDPKKRVYATLPRYPGGPFGETKDEKEAATHADIVYYYRLGERWLTPDPLQFFLVRQEERVHPLTSILREMAWAIRIHSYNPEPTVLNMSVGPPEVDMNKRPLLQGHLETANFIYAEGLSRKLDAPARGADKTVVVLAAGNSGTDMTKIIAEQGTWHPTAWSRVLLVGALGPDGHIASYSNFSRNVDGMLYVPVTGTTDGRLTGLPQPMDGTSFAAPQIDFLINQILKRRPDLTLAQLRAVLFDPAVSKPRDVQPPNAPIGERVRVRVIQNPYSFATLEEALRVANARFPPRPVTPPRAVPPPKPQTPPPTTPPSRLPNLTFYRPSGWDSDASVSAASGATVGLPADTFEEGWRIGLYWAIQDSENLGIRTPFLVVARMDGKEIFRKTVESLGVDKYRTFSVDLEFPSVGSHEVVVTIDADNRIAESNERDNGRILRFKVVAKKDKPTPTPPPRAPTPPPGDTGGSVSFDGTYYGRFYTVDPFGSRTFSADFTVRNGIVSAGAFKGRVDQNGWFTGTYEPAPGKELIPVTGQFSRTGSFRLRGSIGKTSITIDAQRR